MGQGDPSPRGASDVGPLGGGSKPDVRRLAEDHRAVDALDWQDLSDADRSKRTAALLADDRQQGLDLTSAPVARFTVLRTGEQKHEIIWSCHHLFLDGWSSAIVIDDVLAAYRAIQTPGQPQPESVTCSHRDYLAWLKGRDQVQAQGFWQRTFNGFTPPPPLTLHHRDEELDRDPSGYGEVSAALDKQSSQAIRVACSTNQLTPNALIQGAWALLLSVLTRRTT